MRLYVYYDVAPSTRSLARERVEALRADLLPTPMRLMRRADAPTDRDTWMEVYEDVDDGFEARLQAMVARHDLTAVTGPRHVERFVDMDRG